MFSIISAVDSKHDEDGRESIETEKGERKTRAVCEERLYLLGVVHAAGSDHYLPVDDHIHQNVPQEIKTLSFIFCLLFWACFVGF